MDERATKKVVIDPGHGGNDPGTIANDIIEKEPRGYRCKIYSGMLDYLFKQILNNDEDTINILKSWSNWYG